MMDAIGAFFERLLGVHLHYWELSFRRFDVIGVFGGIVAALAADAYLSDGNWKDVLRSVGLQFLVYVSAFLFCFVWKPFRQQLADTASNLSCLALSVAALSGLLLLLMKAAIYLPPLDGVFGPALRRFVYEWRYGFDTSSNYPLATLFAVLALLVIVANTIYVAGATNFFASFASAKIVPLLVGVVLSFVASLVVLWPLLNSIRV